MGMPAVRLLSVSCSGAFSLKTVLPAAKAARWYQVEMALNKAVDLRLAAEIPLAR